MAALELATEMERYWYGSSWCCGVGTGQYPRNADRAKLKAKQANKKNRPSRSGNDRKKSQQVREPRRTDGLSPVGGELGKLDTPAPWIRETPAPAQRDLPANQLTSLDTTRRRAGFTRSATREVYYVCT